MKMESAKPAIKLGLFRIMAALILAVGVNASSQAQTTLPAGGGQSFSHVQPGLAMHHVMATIGAYPSPENSSTDGLTTVHLFAGPSPAYAQPSLQGQLYPKSGNEALFSLLGTTFGGDGITDFALPNLGGRFTVGTGTPNWGSSPLLAGQGYGDPLTQLTLATLPEHRHSLGDGSVRTTYSGASEPISQHAPSLPMIYMIATEGNFPNNLSLPMIGMIRSFAGDFVPAGWLPADGRLMNKAENDALFQVIGTLYGGDGQTTFALPDLRGRVAVGYGPGAGLNLALGQSTGAPDISLTTAQLPVHSHDLSGGGSTNPTGSTQAFSNLQPSLGIKYLIATQGIVPSLVSGSFNAESPTLGEVIAFAGNSIPTGSAECAGQLLLISNNMNLFNLLGTTYGRDGTTHFALPDLRGRAPIGVGNGFVAGQIVGSSTTTLSVNTMSTHTHDITYEIFENGFE